MEEFGSRKKAKLSEFQFLSSEMMYFKVKEKALVQRRRASSK